MTPDLDVCELHLSIRDFETRQPYVDSSGLTSQNLPYESIELVDQMYEPNAQELPTARITLPSLQAFPELRPLLQKIKEGNRVELYNFQPDCGSPVWAGFIPPNGITESDGKTTLDAVDAMGQLRWQHLRRLESFDVNAAGLYRRALRGWVDLVNEDFAKATTTSADWALVANWLAADGFLQFNAPAGFQTASSVVSNLYNWNSGTPVPIGPGDTVLMEADLTLNNDFAGATDAVDGQIALGNGTQSLVARLGYARNNLAAGQMIQTVEFVGTGVSGLGGPTAFGTQMAVQMPQTHHLACLLVFDQTAGTLTATVFLDEVNIANTTVSWGYGTVLLTPWVASNTTATDSGDYARFSSLRMARLAPIVNQAPRFNPQTTDAVSYQPNLEDNLQFLQLVAQKDDAEYRPDYKAWPQTDELELDQVGTLGAFPSRTLGYEQPGASPLIKAPDAAPFAVDADAPYGSFITAPPFRLEEGWNLAGSPRIGSKENAHSNDVIRVGASTMEAQVFGEKWSVAELGRPQSVAGSPASYPRFEQITNDDRVGLQSLAQTLAGLELVARTDPTPSLEVDVVDEVWSAFKWRAGDFVFAKTQSLRANVEQEMRVVKVQYKAGSPQRTVTLGRTDWDPERRRLTHDALVMNWLYEQSGTSPAVYVYPSVGSIGAGANSTSWIIALDQYTSGTAIVYAALHWFADANVGKLQPTINGQRPFGSSPVTASSTDSGLQVCTGLFQSPGQYTISFLNNDSVSRNLTAAFLVLRIKG